METHALLFCLRTKKKTKRAHAQAGFRQQHTFKSDSRPGRMRSRIGKVQDSMESLLSLLSNGSSPMSTPILTQRQSPKQRRELVLSIRLLAITPCITTPFNNRGKGITIHDLFLSSRPSCLDHGNTCTLFCLRTKKKTKRAKDKRRLDFDSSTPSCRDSRPSCFQS